MVLEIHFSKWNVLLVQDYHYYRPFLVWVICQIPYIPEDHVNHLKFMWVIKWIRNMRFGLHFLWVHQVSPKNILLSILIKGWNALSKSPSLSLLSHAGVKLLINSLKDLLFDSLKTKLSPVLPQWISSVP